jgi:hypothetical protein
MGSGMSGTAMPPHDPERLQLADTIRTSLATEGILTPKFDYSPLLVPEAQWADANLALQRDGYALIARDAANHREAALRRHGGHVRVEVHRLI